MKKLFFAFALLGTFTTQALADCLVGHFKMIFRKDVSNVAVKASSGAPCSIPLYFNLKTGNTAGITEVILLKKPKNGTADAPLSANVSYISKAGYKGADDFSVRFCMSNAERTTRRCSTLKYKINVS